MSSPRHSLPFSGLPTPPEGTEVASYRTYAEAQAAVDHLSDQQYRVRYLTIVGTDLRLVERITGRLTWGKVLLSGAMSGMWLGFFMALLFAIWSTQNIWPLLVTGLVIGAIFGMIFNVVPYALTKGKRDFTSATQVVASRYAILASQNVDEFREALRSTPGNLTRPKPTVPPVDMSKPSAFGSRPDEQPKFGVRLTPEQRKEHAQQRAIAQSGHGPVPNQEPNSSQTRQNEGTPMSEELKSYGQQAKDQTEPPAYKEREPKEDAAQEVRDQKEAEEK